MSLSARCFPCSAPRPKETLPRQQPTSNMCSTTQLYPDVLLHRRLQHKSLGQLLRHYYDSENTQNGNPKQSTAATMDTATGQLHSQHHRYGWIPAPCQQKVQPQHRQCPGPDSLEQRKSTGILARLVLISQARAFSATVNHSSLR